MTVGAIDAERIERARTLMAQRRRIDAQLYSALGELDDSASAQAAGYMSLPSLIEDLWRVDGRDARSWCAQSLSLAESAGLSGGRLPARYPDTAAALAEGAVGREHVAVIDRVLRRVEALPTLEPGDLAAAERILAMAARSLSPHGVERVGARLLARLDPDGVAPDEKDPPDRALRVRRRRAGGIAFDGTFAGALDSATFLSVLDALATPAGPDDARTLDERRADALLELCDETLSPTGLTPHATPDNRPDAEPDDGPGDGLSESAFDGARSTADRPADDWPAEDWPAEDWPADVGRDRPNADGRRGGDRTWNVEPAVDQDEREPDEGRADEGPHGPDDDELRDDETQDDETRDDAGSQGAEPAAERGQRMPDDAPDDARATARNATRAAGRVAGRVQMTVTVGLDDLRDAVGHALLDDDRPVPPSAARRLACDAGVVPVVLGGQSEPLDVGRIRYTVPIGMRRALHARDRGCAWPGCGRPPRRCHGHHVRHWADGGSTSLDNLVLLCRHHHDVVHRAGWRVALRTGRAWFVPPPWIDPEQRARPGGPGPPAGRCG